TTQAMDGAAANGHQDGVKWLHEHRSEGCTVAAMDGAAEHGHLKMHHSGDGQGGAARPFSSCAMASHSSFRRLHMLRHKQHSRSHFEVLLFLHSQFKQVCTAETVELAARHKDMRIHAWILSHYPQLRRVAW
ncbi:hypothetical protein PHYSODRAFT_509463, partial [Phytophthora sojae]